LGLDDFKTIREHGEISSNLFDEKRCKKDAWLLFPFNLVNKKI
jgi:hypothetical protein